MKKYYGNYLGLCIDNNDPQKRGRVQIFVPHIMPALYENWNEVGEDIKMLCVGDNLPASLPSAMVEKLKKILPWAEAALPIMGTSAPGNLEGGSYNQFPESVCPEGTVPVPVAQATSAGQGGPLSVPGVGQVSVGNGGQVIERQSTQAKSRKNPISSGLTQAIQTGLQGSGLNFVVISGSQTGPGASRPRGASDRHDDGRAADGDFIDASTNRVLNPASNSEDRARISQVLPRLRAAGIQGIGWGTDYMGPSRFHLDIVTPSIWGANGRSANAAPWVVAAVGGQSGPQVSSGAVNENSGGQGFVCYPASTSGQMAATNPLNSPNPIDNNASVAVPLASNTGGAGGGLGSVNLGQTSNTSGETLTLFTTNFSTDEGPGGNTDSNTAAGRSATGQNLTPGIIGIPPQFFRQYAGTILLDRKTNNTYIIAETGGVGSGSSQGLAWNYSGYRGGATNDMIGDRYVDPQTYQSLRASGQSNFLTQYDVIGRVPRNQIPTTAQGITDLLNTYGSPYGAAAPTGQSASSTLNTGLPQQNGNLVMNPDTHGPTPLININNMAAGMFSYPAAGAVLWTFFREGNPLFPVYFGVSYGEREWASAYRLPGPGQDGVGYKPSPTNENPVTSVGLTWNMGKVGVHQAFYVNDPTNPLNNERSYIIGGHDGSNIAFTEGLQSFLTKFDRRDQIEGDHWKYVGGFTEEWYQGNKNTNYLGDVVTRIGNTSQRAVDAVNQINDYINQIMAPLAQSGTTGSPASPSINSSGPSAQTQTTMSGVNPGTAERISNEPRPKTFIPTPFVKKESATYFNNLAQQAANKSGSPASVVNSLGSFGTPAQVIDRQTRTSRFSGRTIQQAPYGWSRAAGVWNYRPTPAEYQAREIQQRRMGM